MADLGFLSDVASGLTIAVVTSIITVRLSTKRFQSEKWWELKAETYKKIIVSLHHLKVTSEVQLEQLVDDVSYTDDFLNKMVKRAQAAYRTLKEVADTGTFLLPQDALEVLSVYTENTDDHNWNDQEGDHQNEISEAEKALAKIIPIAQRDLNTNVFDDFLYKVAKRWKTIIEFSRYVTKALITTRTFIIGFYDRRFKARAEK